MIQSFFWEFGGSSPANGEEFDAYGKHTSCYLVTLDGTSVMVDCGTGVQRAESLSWPARLITILDIFEALTAADRPYRDSMNVGRALQILEEMVSEGKLDGSILKEYEKSEAWKNADNSEKCSENAGIESWITRK